MSPPPAPRPWLHSPGLAHPGPWLCRVLQSTWWRSWPWRPADTHCSHGSSRQHLPSAFRPYLLPIGNVGAIQLCRLYEHINIPEAGKMQRVQASSGTQEDTPPNAIPLFPTPTWRTIEQISASVPICWLCLCVRLGGPHLSYLGMFWFSGTHIPASSACVAWGQD